MSARRAYAGKTAVDFNKQDTWLAIRLILAAGALFFATVFAIFWMGKQSIVSPVVSVIVSALILALAFFAGQKLHAWAFSLSANTRRLAFIMGVIPWNLALFGIFSQMGVGPQLQEVQSIDQSAWSEETRTQVKHLVEIQLSLQSEQVLLLRTAIMSLVALVLGMTLVGLRRRFDSLGLGYSGALLMAAGVAGFAFIMGRNTALVSAMIDGFTRLGVM